MGIEKCHQAISKERVAPCRLLFYMWEIGKFLLDIRCEFKKINGSGKNVANRLAKEGDNRVSLFVEIRKCVKDMWVKRNNT